MTKPSASEDGTQIDLGTNLFVCAVDRTEHGGACEDAACPDTFKTAEKSTDQKTSGRCLALVLPKRASGVSISGGNFGVFLFCRDGWCGYLCGCGMKQLHGTEQRIVDAPAKRYANKKPRKQN